MRLAVQLARVLERLIPSGMSSRPHFSRQLDIYGAPRLPKEVIRDLAHQAVELANFVAGPGGGNRHEYVAIYLNEQAANIATWLSERRRAGDRHLADEDVRELMSVLSKHGVFAASFTNAKETMKRQK